MAWGPYRTGGLRNTQPVKGRGTGWAPPAFDLGIHTSKSEGESQPILLGSPFPSSFRLFSSVPLSFEDAPHALLS